MKIFYGFDNIALERPTVVSIGSFDGVHRGHQQLIRTIQNVAQRIDALSVVLSFEPHPRIAMGRADGMRLLTSVEERALLLERMGVDLFVVAHFDQKFREQSYDEFVRRCLVDRLRMRGMVVGYNHRLGRDSEGGYDTLLPLSRELGFELERVEQFTVGGGKISSTVVRNLFDEGDMERAAELLGHRYIVMGRACCGVLAIENQYKLVPKDGRYHVTVVGRGESHVDVVNGKILVDESLEGDVIIEF